LNGSNTAMRCLPCQSFMIDLSGFENTIEHPIPTYNLLGQTQNCNITPHVIHQTLPTSPTTLHHSHAKELQPHSRLDKHVIENCHIAQYTQYGGGMIY
jgi:hypothetical protein